MAIFSRKGLAMQEVTIERKLDKYTAQNFVVGHTKVAEKLESINPPILVHHEAA